MMYNYTVYIYIHLYNMTCSILTYHNLCNLSSNPPEVQHPFKTRNVIPLYWFVNSSQFMYYDNPQLILILGSIIPKIINQQMSWTLRESLAKA